VTQITKRHSGGLWRSSPSSASSDPILTWLICTWLGYVRQQWQKPCQTCPAREESPSPRHAAAIAARWAEKIDHQVGRSLELLFLPGFLTRYWVAIRFAEQIRQLALNTFSRHVATASLSDFQLHVSSEMPRNSRALDRIALASPTVNMVSRPPKEPRRVQKQQWSPQMNTSSKGQTFSASTNDEFRFGVSPTSTRSHYRKK